MITYIFASFGASLAFAYIFNIRGNRLIYAGIGGSVGYVVYGISKDAGLSITLSMFLASISLSLYCEIIARISKAPVTLFLVASLIPLVPGGGMYRMMLAILQSDTAAFSSYGLETMLVAGAIGLGTMLASTAVKLAFQIKNYKKKVL